MCKTLISSVIVCQIYLNKSSKNELGFVVCGGGAVVGALQVACEILLIS